MLLSALRQIGEAIADNEFVDEWDRYYSPGKMDGAETIIGIRLREDESGSFAYDGTSLHETSEPVELAHQTAYVYNHKRDSSLTQRIAGNPSGNVEYVLEWVNRDEIGDAADLEPIPKLRETFEAAHDDIVDGVMEYFEGGDALSPSSNEPVFVTVVIERSDGTVDWPGDINAIRQGIRRYYQSKIETKSAGTGNAGTTECSVCGTRTDVYGAGATLDRLYSLKKQGWFPELNASLAWRNRPICVECITAIETGWERFVSPQNYGAPGIRCRIFPYALPVEGGQERLSVLMRNARQDLLGARADSDEPNRPLSNAWAAYLREVNLDVEDDVLRLAFLHYRKDQTRSNTLNWIDGVRQPYVVEIEDTASSVVESPLYETGILAGGPSTDTKVGPTEREIFTGMWAYEVLARESTRSGDDPEPAESRFWLEITQEMLTKGEIDYHDFVAAAANEIRERADRDLESDVEDAYYSPPYDTIHVSRVYCLLQTIVDLEIISGPFESNSTTMTDLENEYESLDAAVASVIERHDSIAKSPGRRSAFILGVMASQLSSWQQRRGLNRTFIQNVSIESIEPRSLSKLKTKIWDKAKTYNAQQGNYGVPWSELHARMDKALLEGEEVGWQATRDEMQTYFTMGTTMGPRLASRVVSDSESETEAATT